MFGRSPAQSMAAQGYEVTTLKSTACLQRHPRRFTCRGVVFAASSLGTMELLFHLKGHGSLPKISGQAGQVRAHQLRIAHRSARARIPRDGPVERRRHRLGSIH